MGIIKKFRIKSFKNVNSIIRFENISISYGNRTVLDNVNFRINDDGVNKSGHLYEDFLNRTEEKGWKIVYEQDITKNALPTLRFAMVFINRFIKPLASFAGAKLKNKKAWLFYLTDEFRKSISKKTDKELAALDPENFIKEKIYILYVLERE